MKIDSTIKCFNPEIIKDQREDLESKIENHIKADKEVKEDIKIYLGNFVDFYV